MSTAYDTLSTSTGEEFSTPRRSFSNVKIAFGLLGVAGMAVVAMRGGLSFTGAASSVNPTFNGPDGEAYNALDGTPVQCQPVDGDKRAWVKELPMWDPRFSNGDTYQAAFYNACYFAFRCCTTTSNNNGCYVSSNFGAQCKNCLANNAPRMVVDRCAQVIEDPVLSSATEWGEADLYEDNYVPEFDTGTSTPTDMSDADFTALLAEAMLNINSLKNDTEYGDVIDEGCSLPEEDPNYDDVCVTKHASCWKRRSQNADLDAKDVGFANKCFEVLSWCNLLCPRDTPQTADHVMCKHCVLFGFEEGNWSGDVFTNQLNGASVNSSLCGFFPDRCDCKPPPCSGAGSNALQCNCQGFSGYPIGWEYCPKVHMATKYNSGQMLDPEDATRNIMINRVYPGSAGPENYFASSGGIAELNNCLQTCEDEWVRQGSCSNSEYAAQSQEQATSLFSTRVDSTNPMLGGFIDGTNVNSAIPGTLVGGGR